MIFFLCVSSLIFWVIQLSIPTILSPFVCLGIFGHPFYNLFVYAGDMFSFRNGGMFWEPGAFQIFINLALLIELLKNLPRGRVILVYVITIITTFSTTGFLGMGMLFLIPFFILRRA